MPGPLRARACGFPGQRLAGGRARARVVPGDHSVAGAAPGHAGRRRGPAGPGGDRGHRALRRRHRAHRAGADRRCGSCAPTRPSRACPPAGSASTRAQRRARAGPGRRQPDPAAAAAAGGPGCWSGWSPASRHLGAALASWQISRRTVTQSGPVLLAVLAVATGTLALAQYQSWQRSARDQAAFAAGADVRVAQPAGPLTWLGPGAIGQRRGVTAMPVTASRRRRTGRCWPSAPGRPPAPRCCGPTCRRCPRARLWRLLAPPAARPGAAAAARIAVGPRHGQPDGPAAASA